jgi:hypothetical protein
MKNVILSMVFVFATVSMTNANLMLSNEGKLNLGSNDCDEVYNRTRDFVHGMTGNLYIRISAAIAAEEACLSENEVLEPVF